MKKTFSVSFSPNSALPDIIKVMTTTMTKGSYVYTPYQSITVPSRSVFLVVEEILLAATQPLTATEVTEAVSRKLDKAFTESPIRLVLVELTSLRKISSRIETHRERVTRANDAAVRSSKAALFWAPYADGIVPERTKTEAIPGMILFQKELYPKRSMSTAVAKKKRREAVKQREAQKREAKRVSKKTPRETYSTTNSSTTLSNPVIDFLIEKIVTEKTAELTKTLQETQAELARLRGFLKSAIGN